MENLLRKVWRMGYTAGFNDGRADVPPVPTVHDEDELEDLIRNFNERYSDE